MRVQARIKNKEDDVSWEETFDVSSVNQAELEIKKIIDGFNATLGSGEKSREFICLVDLDVKLESEGEFISRAYKFLGRVRRDANNPFGSSWCRDKVDIINKIVNNLSKKGNVARLKKLVGNSPFSRVFEDLINSPIKTIQEE